MYSDNEDNVEYYLIDLIESDPSEEWARVEPYHDTGLLTKDHGFVLTMNDGSEFQVTIVQSRWPKE